MMLFIKIFSLLLTVVSLTACKAGGAGETENNPTPPIGAVADYEILFIGNSHSSSNGLPNLVATLIKTGLPNKTVNVGLAPGNNFLAERLDDGVTLSSLTSRSWTHVSLQAQKYSSTGKYSYPTNAAEEWIRRITAQNGTPIMFPEWPRRGNIEEGLRVHNLHLGIATTEPACVAPIGLAWDLSIARHPTLNLHAYDGNHSNLTGALLTAYVFYEVITKQSVNELAYVSSINVPQTVQNQLKDIVSEIVLSNTPCPEGF